MISNHNTCDDINDKNIVTVYQLTHKKTSYTEVSHFNKEQTPI